MNMKKVFDKEGDTILRFAKDSKEQIEEWLDGWNYDSALESATEVSCPIFGEALDFPCTIIETK